MGYKVIFKNKECIGAAECAVVAPEFWAMKGSKAELLGAKLNAATGNYELLIDEKDFKKHDLAAKSCPVGAIQIQKA